MRNSLFGAQVAERSHPDVSAGSDRLAEGVAPESRGADVAQTAQVDEERQLMTPFALHRVDDGDQLGCGTASAQ